MMRIPRESVEYLPLTITVDGVEATDYQVSVVPRGQRPSTWVAGPYLIDGLAPALYDAYVRVVDLPERPVDQPVTFAIT